MKKIIAIFIIGLFLFTTVTVATSLSIKNINNNSENEEDRESEKPMTVHTVKIGEVNGYYDVGEFGGASTVGVYDLPLPVIKVPLNENQFSFKLEWDFETKRNFLEGSKDNIELVINCDISGSKIEKTLDVSEIKEYSGEASTTKNDVGPGELYSYRIESVLYCNGEKLTEHESSGEFLIVKSRHRSIPFIDFFKNKPFLLNLFFMKFNN